jgi:alkylation response protein AidB-like acyl-CoA dehydrogenase
VKMTIRSISGKTFDTVSPSRHQELPNILGLLLERMLRDAAGSTLDAGTSEMERSIIARWLMP